MRISINIFTSFEVENSEEAVKKAKRNREWRYEYMTLLMRDQENQEIGEKRGEKRGEKNGKEKMVVNALVTTKSVIQTANILQLSEQEVREIAKSKKLCVND